MEHFTRVHLYSINTFHAIVDGTMYPLVYSLLPGKSQQVYTTSLSTQRHTMYAINGIFTYNQQHYSWTTKQPFGMQHTQFSQKSIPKASSFTTPNLFGGTLSLIVYKHKEHDSIHQLVCRAAVLPLLPTDTVEDVWFNANVNITTLAFTDYVTSYWVEGDCSLWNHYTPDGPRTTNHLEGWHNKLKKLVNPPIQTSLVLSSC